MSESSLSFFSNSYGSDQLEEFFSNFWMIRIFIIFPIPQKNTSMKVGNLRYLEPEESSLKK